MNERVSFPDLHLPALGAVPQQLDLDQQRARWRSLAGAVAGVVLSPWLAWKLTDLGWVGPVDALFFLLAGEAVSLLGVGWGLIAFREDKNREVLRLQRAGQESRLFEQGYSALYAAFDQVAQSALSPDHVALLNFGQFDERLSSVAGRVDDIAAGVMAALHREPAAPSVTVCSVPAQCNAGGEALGKIAKTATPALESEPSILPLLDWPYSPLAECFVGRAIQGQGFGLKSFLDLGICSEPEYRDLVGQLLAAGVLVRVDGRPALAADLDAWRSAWALSAADFAQQMAFEDDAHRWAADLLAVVPSPVASSN
ncbi:MAG: hypothetical protein M3Z04_10335 [Chloroflexota bacterium]|nr:hypothetical protein [Chloroflexota bacterium]